MEVTVNFPICSIVIEALKGVEPDRRCFRMIGGVLVERTVKDVLPALENNKEQVRTLNSRWSSWLHHCPCL